MHFAASGVNVAVWVPPVVALVVSFGTSMAGVSGAFLLLPFQVSFLGYTAPSVSATNHVFNVVAAPSGVWRYVREGRMVWPLCLMVIAGGVPGAFAGALVRIHWLRDPGAFKGFVALVLLVIGGRMVWDLLRGRRAAGHAEDAERRFQALAGHHHDDASDPCDDLPRVAVRAFTLRRTRYEFCGEEFEFPTLAAAAVSLLVGVVGGVYGIGGGALIAPLLVTFFRLPVYTIAGTALMSTCVVSAAGVAMYQGLALIHPALSVAPDWPLGLLFAGGGVAGMYLGARCQKYVPSRAIKGLLSAVILLAAARYLLEVIGP